MTIDVPTSEQPDNERTQQIIPPSWGTAPVSPAAVPQTRPDSAPPVYGFRPPPPFPYTGVVPGPPTARDKVDRFNVSDRGQLVNRVVRQRVRHFIPVLLRYAVRSTLWSLLALAALLAFGLLPGHPAWLVGMPATPARIVCGLLVLLAAASWIRSLYRSVRVVLEARLFTVRFHEHGIEVFSGVSPRTKQLFWYYLMPEEPQYVRTAWTYLTHTASLVVGYHGTAAPIGIHLTGVGTPAEVNDLRTLIEARRLVERAKAKGFIV